jgi:restriction system protein
LHKLFSEQRKGYSLNEDYDDFTGLVCQVCGWWKAVQEVGIWGVAIRGMRRFSHERFCQSGSLKNLDLTDLSVPLADIRSFLLARYDRRFSMHPRLFEETVGSVFASLKYTVEVTAYSNDGGIDVILRKNDEQVGVQVKRYKNSVGVDQIRSFTGALVDRGISKGVFVTTSQFQRGANALTDRLALKGYQLT